jgi:hypothetical protein
MVTYRPTGKKRQLLKRILILCEGETEKLYLDAYKASLKREVQRGIDLTILQANNSEPLRIIKEAEKKNKIAKEEQQPYDSIWLVFDDDNRPKLQQIFALAKSKRFSIAYNSISIEFWFILHFERIGREFETPDKAIRHLKQHIAGYKKTSANTFKSLTGRYLTNALPNSAWLKKEKNISSMYEAWQAKPITTMDELTRSFDEWNKQSVWLR